MIEMDHTAPPPPEPAKPILASRLLVIEETQRKRFAERGENIKTGCSDIDNYVLGGGLERGIVVGISGDGKEGRLISLNLLASVLVSNLSTVVTTPNFKPKATIIDTTGSFPIPLLASIVKSQLISDQEILLRNQETTGNYEASGQRHRDDVVDQWVQRCLEMVTISRVFDLEGLWEVLSEVSRGSIARKEQTSDAPHVGGGQSEAVIPDPPVEAAQFLREVKEEKEAGIEGDASIRIASNAIPLENDPEIQNQNSNTKPEEANDEGTEIIIIDNMTNIINELFARKEKSEAHNLLTTLSQIIHTIAHTNNILTLLHNSTVLAKSTYSDPTPKRQTQQTQHSLTSIFTDNPLKPALGRIFDQTTELHLFLSRMPKMREDAEILYGQDDMSSPFDSNVVEYCTVLEVLKDETPNLVGGKGGFAQREQRWTALQVGSDGLALMTAFQERGTMRGLGLEKDRPLNVGDVAKIYGFGGRSV